MPDQQNQTFDQWCIIELFGRQVVAGRVTEQTIGGCAFIRVDVPAFDDSPPVTHFYGQGAIYGMTPVSEEVAFATLKYHHPAPTSVYVPLLQANSDNTDLDEDSHDRDEY